MISSVNEILRKTHVNLSCSAVLLYLVFVWPQNYFVGINTHNHIKHVILQTIPPDLLFLQEEQNETCEPFHSEVKRGLESLSI